MPRNPQEYGRNRDEEDEDNSREWLPTARRIVDANAYFDTTHLLLDSGTEPD